MLHPRFNGSVAPEEGGSACLAQRQKSYVVGFSSIDGPPLVLRRRRVSEIEVPP